MLKKINLILMSLLILSCGKANKTDSTENYLAAPAGSFEGIYESLQYLEQGTNILVRPQSRPERLKASEILKAIHPWLQKGVGLTEVSRGEFTYLTFSRSIPETIASAILEKAFDDERFDSGFLFLQKSFWKFAKQNGNPDSSEKTGLGIAFLTESPQPIAGVYFSDYRLIAFDVYSSTSTLAHELRHHSQRTSDEELKVTYPSSTPVLTQECRESLRKYFGEFQATLIQFPYWARALKHVPLIPKNEAEILRLKDRSKIALKEMILANLLYPVDSAYWVSDNKSCTEPVRRLVNSLADFANDQKDELTKTLPKLLYSHRANYKACLKRTCSAQEKIKFSEEAESGRILYLAEFHRAHQSRKNKIRELLKDLLDADEDTYLDMESSISSVRDLAARPPYIQNI